MLIVISLLVVICVVVVSSIAGVIFIRYRNNHATDSTKSTQPSGSSSSGSSPVAHTGGGGTWKKTGVTFYGQSKADDNGVGFAGVDLFKHGTAGLKFDGKVVFPVAVFQADAASLLWKVIEIQSDSFTKSKTVYGHVVDVCNSGQDVCKRNTAKHGFLVDIHKTAFEYVGADDGLHVGQYRLVGELKPSDLPGSVFLKDGTVACSCTGSCNGGSVKWKKRSAC
jgi:hypothetical protein